MKTELIDVSPTRKEIKIEIEARASCAQLMTASAIAMRSSPTCRAFVAAHAPRSVVRTRFKDEIRSEVLRELVPQAIQDAIAEHTLDVIGEPDVHLDNSEGLGQDWAQSRISLHVHVEVLPEVALGEYKGLEAARRMRPVDG